MEIRPILSALLRNRAGALLVALQIAITLAIVVNAVYLTHQRVSKISRDSGIDVATRIAGTSNVTSGAPSCAMSSAASAASVVGTQAQAVSLP